MSEIEPTDGEVQQLRRCLRDLVALSTLPAVWTGDDARRVAESLAEVLRHMLGLELVYIALRGEAGADPVEVAHTAGGPAAPGRVQEIGRSLAPWLRAESPRPLAEIPAPLGDGVLRVALVPLGIGAADGVLVAGARQAGFPTESDRLLLGIGANQAAILLERRRAEEALYRREQEFKALVENSPDLTARLDRAFRFLYVNPALEQATGRAARDLVGKTNRELGMPEELCTAWERGLESAFATGRDQTAEFRLPTRTGTRSYQVRFVPELARDGSVATVLADARDITELKRTEEVLKEADRRKDEFLAMLAHELRNPLSAINSALQLARRPGLDQEHRAWTAEVIERQVKHLARLIDDLLDVSRITRGKIQLRREHLDASTIVYRSVEVVRPLIEERRHELQIAIAPGGLRVEADPTRLEQILVNLLANAAKYTEAGGQIWLTAGPDGGEVVIRVRDNGIGIEPESLPRMFELFAQGDRSLARSEGGLGIGLTLVQKLAELHGGRVTATSAGPGQGSEFALHLPAAKAPPAVVPAAPRPAPRAAGHGTRILVVDDNRDSARGLSRLLQLLGHDVRTAHDGRAALAAARLHRPEVVLLDIGLPGMDGYQVAAQLRKEDGLADTLIIATSGYGEERAIRRARESGFDHHLVKPLDYDALLTLLTRDEPVGPSDQDGPGGE